MSTEVILDVQQLTVNLPKHQAEFYPLHNISFQIKQGKTLALVGESGSGKSMTALSLMRLLPRKARFAKNSRILFQNEDLLLLPEKKMRAVRGSQIAMIFQEPMTALNPVLTVKQQLAEVMHLSHKNIQEEKFIELLKDVGISDPHLRLQAYPHQLSGGMKQRVLIAIAIALNPTLLIADEPTTALDVTTQAQILQLLKSLQQKQALTILFISHDLALVQQFADEVAVMYAGEIVEYAPCKTFFDNPKHPYSKKLLNAVPRLVRGIQNINEQPLLQLKDVSVEFKIKKEWWKSPRVLTAVQPTNISVEPGKTLALVGESGCGKTTLAKAILQLIPLTQGKIIFTGETLSAVSQSARQQLARQMQMVFQDPFSAMDPRFTVFDIIAEGLIAQNFQGNLHEEITKWIAQVGLPIDSLDRYPHEFSGGQRQRIAIARALILKPDLIICDEPTSALDVSVQAQILELLAQLQKTYGISYILITHNIAVVEYLADFVAVMYLGRIVEYGSVNAVLTKPLHPYTQALLAAVPRINHPLFNQAIIQGDLPSPLKPPSGCAFHPRCLHAMAKCKNEIPPDFTMGTQQVNCWLYETSPVVS